VIRLHWQRTPLRRYGFALASSTAVVLIRLALVPLLGPNLPYILFFPAVMASSWYGGFGPGLLTTGLSSLAAAYFLLSPATSDVIGLVLFIAAGIMISWLNEALLRAHGRLQTELVARQRAENALRESEERYRVTSEAASDAIITIDQDSTILYANPATANIFGYAPTEIIGRSITLLMPEYLRELHRSAIARYVNTGERHISWSGTELTGLHKNGVEIPIEVSFGEWRDSERHRFTGIIRDITERRNTREALAERAAELKRSNEELEQYAYVASHDLQEPLRMVSNFAQLLLKNYRGKLDSDGEEFLSYIDIGVKRMHNLVRDLLSYSRVVADREDQFSPADMNMALDNAIADCQAEIDAGGAAITYTELPQVRGDLQQLTQLFQNMLGNALKYRRPGEPPRIHITAQKKESEWLFSIADNGIGIAPQHHGQIFGLFKRLHGQDIPGTGIGLAICRRVVESHHGRIWVESENGQGSIFYFTVPFS
jgi:PAS domain S-box-containing protein